ncbi:MAG: glycoside hydrolase family 3 protein [Candidatus Eremiobacteraeota bacterium]|nr:glycoside hydrolase family 3 protein [Candidatus Eremiobacteraeota bacterium]
MTQYLQLARDVIVSGIKSAQLDPALPRFGGYVFFTENGASPQELRALTDALRAREEEMAAPPPILAIDQEGGRVARLRDDVESMPPMMALGAAGNLELAQRAGEQIAFDLRRAGCTLDFAPVLDLALDPKNTVIGTRSFGDDPTRVAELGMAVAHGLRNGGILPCYKHFPGHGSTAVDSHDALPVVDADEATLRDADLVPFAAIAAEAIAMMTGHLRVTAFDSQHPATLSPRIATQLVRDELGFRGTLFSDCLEMRALPAHASPQTAVAALAAGVDLLIFSHDSDAAAAAADVIAKSVEGGDLPLHRLQAAHQRAERLRSHASAPLELDAFPPHPTLGREIARNAVTLVRGIGHADPLASIVIAFGENGTALRHEAPALQEITVALEPQPADVRRILDGIENSQRRPLLLTHRAHLYPAQADAVAAIMAGYPDALAVSTAEPFDLPLFPQARHLLACYGNDLASIGGLADVLFGGSMPSGRLPVSLSW